MTSSQFTKNYTFHPPEDYDDHIDDMLPFHLSFHQETINLVKSFPSSPKVWMDSGCGTASLVNKAIKEFPDTKFILVDPSEGMLDQARRKLSSYPEERLEFMGACTTQECSQKLKEKPDVITAIQCHHYLSREERNKATNVCYNLLKEGGIYITFENIKPLTEEGFIIVKRYWSNFQLSHGRNKDEIKKLYERFNTDIFPITVDEHLKLMKETGFKIVELFWYSYMQAGFYGIK